MNDYTQIKISNSDEIALENLREWVIKYTGINYPVNKKDILYFRLLNLCVSLNIKDLSQLYLHLINEDIENITLKIAQYISTTHTYFYREKETLNYFKKILLDLINEFGELRIWSSATSSGEEAYTIAIIAIELLGFETAMNKVKILGTDINQMVIKQAERGIYSAEKLKEYNDKTISKYFKLVGMKQYEIDDKLKRMCVFRRFNLHSESFPFSNKFHIIFCRNVLYYFKLIQQEALINKMFDISLDKAYLLTSVTESISIFNTKWNTIKPGIHTK